MIDNGMMILQNRTNSQMEIQDSCDETNPISHDASQAVNIKLEEASLAEEEAGPVPISFLKIKAEPEVRCMSLYVHCKQLSYPCTRPRRSVGM
jgi:hypothetical protein